MNVKARNFKYTEALSATILHVFFFLVFCSVSLLNHYFLRTAALDYGLANQALYQCAHFKWPVCTLLIQPDAVPYLGLHLSFWVPLFSPLYWVFGSYTLLLLQNLALIFCGIGIYKVALQKLASTYLAWLITAQFYVSFALYAALASDYHDNVIGACFFPWLFYYYGNDKKFPAVLCFLAMLISKENFAIWLPFVLVGLIIINKQWHYRQWLFALGLMLVCVVWFLGASLWIMPALSLHGQFEQLSRFSHLGKSLGEILGTIVSRPLYVFSLFYEGPGINDPDQVIKQELLYTLLLSGGLALLWRPAFLLMVLPLLMQKLWNKETAFWSISNHYTIEFAPVIAIAVICMVGSVKSSAMQRIVTWLMLISTAGTTFMKMQNRRAYFDEQKENIFSPSHYKNSLPLSIVFSELSKIPPDEQVSAQANLAPHIAFRDGIYHFPFIKNAGFIAVFDPTTKTYPLSESDYILLIDSLKQSAAWEVFFHQKPMLILKRK